MPAAFQDYLLFKQKVKLANPKAVWLTYHSCLPRAVT
jgi:hypothetical protein